MSVRDIPWIYEGGEHCVIEVEHLFGFDLILSRRFEGERYPVGIISRLQRLSEWERKAARAWCDSTDAGMYDWAAKARETLNTDPIPTL